MAASSVISSPGEVRAFFSEYFGAWQGTDIERIMGYYSDSVSLFLVGTMMNGKDTVEHQFVRPFVTGFPGNRHIAKNMIFGDGQVTVEWSFEPASGSSVKVPGCSVYEYDLAKRQTTGGRIYLDLGTLLKQIGAA